MQQPPFAAELATPPISNQILLLHYYDDLYILSCEVQRTEFSGKIAKYIMKIVSFLGVWTNFFSHLQLHFFVMFGHDKSLQTFKSDEATCPDSLGLNSNVSCCYYYNDLIRM